MERSIQYVKDRTDGFDDYFPCRKKKCKLKHVMNWFRLFIDQYNKQKYVKSYVNTRVMF